MHKYSYEMDLIGGDHPARIQVWDEQGVLFWYWEFQTMRLALLAALEIEAGRFPERFGREAMAAKGGASCA